MIDDLARKVATDPDNIGKYQIAGIVLTRLNEKGEKTLRERREILKRVVEFENFDVCWSNDRLKAKGLVAEVRKVVNVKDSFTRMRIEKDKERSKRQAIYIAKVEKEKIRQDKLDNIRDRLTALFNISNPYKRAQQFESILNELFKVSGISVQDSFTVKGNKGQGIVEQIDGVIKIDGEFYLVEIKWWEKSLGPGELSQHLVRVFNRGYMRGIFISASGYTEAAKQTCKEALQKAVVILCKLEEIVLLLERKKSLLEFLRKKIAEAMIHKNPMFEPFKHNSI